MANTKIPVELSSTPGIVDNSNATAITIDSSERVGIGTSSPQSATKGIHVVHDATEGSPSFTGAEVGIFQRNFNNAQGAAISIVGGSNSESTVNFADKDDANVGQINYSHSSNAMLFRVNDQERMRIDSSGNVGIGTTSPSQKLSVLGTSSVPPARFTANGNTNALEVFGFSTTDASNGILCNAGTSANDYSARFRKSDGTVIMEVSGNGNVGIGTISPSALLQVGDGATVTAGTNPTTAVFNQKGNWNTNDYEAFKFGISEVRSVYEGSNGWSYTILTGNSSTRTEKMRIDSSGNVLIGATSTNFGAFSSSVSPQLLVSGTTPQVLLHETDTDKDGYIGISGSTMFIQTADAIPMRFGTNDLERMRIASNGRVSIGTTSANAGLHVANADIRCTGAAIANDANSISLSQESSGGFLTARGANTSTRGTISLNVSLSTGGSGIVGLKVENTGNVTIAGALSKGSGSFKIDHPLESKKDTHHLVHSFVEAPQADNIYRGVVTLVDGSATINLDTEAGMTEGTFVLLNTNTSCFTSNESDWDAVKGSVSGNILTISCQNTSSTATVSWLVIGERQDQHMLDTDWTDENGKVIVEPLKGETE